MLFVFAIASLLLSAILSFAFGNNKKIACLITGVGASLGSLFALVYAIPFLLYGGVQSFTWLTVFPLFHISFFVDRLAALFIAIIAIVAIPSTIYGATYLKKYEHYNIGIFSFFYNLFILSLFLVVTSYNGLYFLFIWEIMSLTSLFLVFFEYDKSEVIHGGSIYFMMTHAASACLLFAFLLLYSFTGSFDFAVIKMHAASLPLTMQVIAFILMVIGFGTKAGIIPLHIWLPRAHSVAPSHVSALMSGVMIKMGIFMFFRMFFDILMPSTVWFGIVILIIGGLSSILGVLYALAEHDIKRLLAYHSIENIGIILLGIGSGMIFMTLHQTSLAVLAISAALFHTINHAVFKSLLFLGAGAVISQTHTRNMEEYGGLIKKMPYTSLFFLIGSIAISGLPPFNGFVSEWLTFQGLFKGIIFNDGALINGIFIFDVAMLALTGGLAAACFVKAFGTVFLARSRSKESEHAREVGNSLVVSMGFLALLCLVLSLFSSFVVHLLIQVIADFGINDTHRLVKTLNGSLQVGNIFSLINLPLIIIILLLGFLFGVIFVYLVSHKQKKVIQKIWSCGYTQVTGRMEITATGFARSLILIFRGVFNPSKQDSTEYVDANMRYFSKSKVVTLSVINYYDKHIYDPLHNSFLFLSRQMQKIQGGDINGYLLYIFFTLIGLLIFVHYH